MTAPPQIYAMDVDEWYDAVTAFADDIEDKIHAILDQTTTPTDAEQKLDKLLEPNYIDADNLNLSGQLLVWQEDQQLCLGVPLEDYAEAIFDAQKGHWRLVDSHSDYADANRDNSHRRIAQYAVGTVLWGNPDHLDYMKATAKRHRQLATPYLQALQDAIDSADFRAVDLRDDLIAFLTGCGIEEHTVEICDNSPGPYRTHLEFRTPGGVSRRLLAIAPGDSLESPKVRESFDLPDLADAAIITDHLRFRSLTAASIEFTELHLPSQRGDNPAAYHRAIAEAITMISQALK